MDGRWLRCLMENSVRIRQLGCALTQCAFDARRLIDLARERHRTTRDSHRPFYRASLDLGPRTLAAAATWLSFMDPLESVLALATKITHSRWVLPQGGLGPYARPSCLYD
jgi:hypothetical protein